MALLDWSDERFKLDVDWMDDTHREFIELANLTAASQGAEFKKNFQALVDHTEAHFQQESEMMVACKFSSTPEHEAEHTRILKEMRYFNSKVQAGVIPIGRAYLKQSIPDWFPRHASTMDTALAVSYKASGL